MDEIVIKAMAKWPNVPACYGWLGLDSRGDWRLRDAAVQAVGPFAQSKGEKITHAKWIAFIGRNYASDATGCWFFQNGPQRVYVELESAPWVFRLDAAGKNLTTQTGVCTAPVRFVQDEAGRLFAETQIGLGLLHSQDVPMLANQLDHWLPLIAEVSSQEIEQRYGFVKSPQQLQTHVTERAAAPWVR